jgi:hypothetical protein
LNFSVVPGDVVIGHDEHGQFDFGPPPFFEAQISQNNLPLQAPDARSEGGVCLCALRHVEMSILQDIFSRSSSMVLSYW